MPIQEQHYQITGMKQDNLVGTGFSTKFAHEIKNMRLNTIGDYTTGAWTTEKGTQKNPVWMYTSQIYKDREERTVDPLFNNNPIVKYFPIEMHNMFNHTAFHDNCAIDLSTLKVLGQATINDQWILFGNIICNVAGDTRRRIDKKVDCILRLFISNNTLYCEVLYFGKLNFDLNHPIETLTYFENEDIQKVYFTDGLNQPRVINIVNVKHRFNSSLDILETQFDFVREVKLEEEITIKKLQSGSGLFPPCTVKYALTYYDKYGSETNVVYDSPLYYPTKGERGCSPEELSGDSFEITVSNLDTNFDYIRLYSIIRTSNDATPIVRIVADKAVPQDNTQSITFVDTNTTGEIIDPNVLRYVGGRNITAQTFDQKSNALFLGNVELKTKSVTELLKDVALPTITWATLKSDNTPIKQRSFNIQNTYPYENQMNKNYTVNDGVYEIDNTKVSSQDLKHFKKNESYTFGLQFQDKYGVWSEVITDSNLKKDNDKDNYVYTTDAWYTDVYFSCPKLTLSNSLINILNDYKKVRLVCAKKNNTNRKVIAQGVIDSTMLEQYTINTNKNPFRYTSWFFRPKENLYSGEIANLNSTDYDTAYPLSKYTFGYDNYDKPSAAAYHTYLITELLPSLTINNWAVEVQNDDWCIVGSNPPVGGNFVPKWKVTRDWVTFHSPELDLNDSIQTIELSNVNCNIVGYIPIDTKSSNWKISTDKLNVANWREYTDTRSFKISDIHDNDWSYRTHIQLNPRPDWHSDTDETTYGCDLFPFQNTDLGTNADYDYKIYSTILISKSPITINTQYNTSYVTTNNHRILELKDLIKDGSTSSPFDTLFINIKDDDENFQILNKDSENYTILSNSNNLYAKNVKEIAPYVQPYKVLKTHNAEGSKYVDTVEDSSKPIPITYKTSTHGLFKTNFPADTLEDWTIRWEDIYTPSYHKFEERPYLWLTEIVRTNVNEDDTKNLIFTPCSPAYTLPESGDLTIYGLEGDHYYMRYDCLKTFPYSTSDKNQIVEILSFMCETRVNLDGRYDTKRGLLDNTSVLDTNFNLINKSYTQDNDFYQYTTLDDLSAKLDKFSNQITYTSVKIANEDVDAWTNITLANVDDADGSCGQITKIININDKLFLFQDHGIARINYDEKTALSTDSGIPIELNSSGKYTGIDYVNKNIGCQNKWSISNTKNGLMWIDDSRRELLALDESFTSITTLNGFDAFMINNCNTEEIWTPSNFNNFITFYDKLSKDIYFINKNTCLAWNEIPKTFTSFYDYDRVSALATISNHTLMFRNTDRNGSIYAAREANEYSYFFDKAKPYWITLVCDGSSNQNNNFSLDKIFDTIEYRADIYNLDGDNTNYAKSIFNKKHVWNGYQDSGEVGLDGIRKFNTWRVQLPRHKGTRDRIRNPFCYIKLKEDNLNDSIQTDRIILHDLAVSYTIK